MPPQPLKGQQEERVPHPSVRQLAAPRVRCPTPTIKAFSPIKVQGVVEVPTKRR